MKLYHFSYTHGYCSYILVAASEKEAREKLTNDLTNLDWHQALALAAEYGGTRYTCYESEIDEVITVAE